MLLLPPAAPALALGVGKGATIEKLEVAFLGMTQRIRSATVCTAAGEQCAMP
jgi:hypothetical protein